jgi:glycerol uptake facilitator-like aquaporin
MAVFRSKHISARMAGLYIISQLLGAFCGALMNYCLYYDLISLYEDKARLSGAPDRFPYRGSTALVFGECVCGRE